MDRQTGTLLTGYLEKAKEKLRVAEGLLREGAYDDVVSRAYYAAFHAAQAALLLEGLHAHTHQGLVNLFGLHLVKSGKFEKRFGKFLSNLKDDREQSDYEPYSTIDQDSAQTAVQEAREFLGAVEAYVGPVRFNAG